MLRELPSRTQMLHRLLPALILTTTLFTACGGPQTSDEPAASAAADPAAVQSFLDEYNARYVELLYAANLADWESNTHIVEGDETNATRTKAANEALAQYTGSTDVIAKARAFLEQKDSLADLQVRQLEAVLYKAANFPQTVPDLVTSRIAAETAQVEKLYGYDFKVDGESVTANDIDDRLVDATDLDERLKVWTASKEVGKELKAGLAELVALRNGTVRDLGYADYFDYQVSDYGMSVDEMVALNEGFVRELWPLYRELHTWTRYELARRYGAEVPEYLPAHWLTNRWGQDWSEMVTVEGLDLDAALADRQPEWVVKQAEDFYVSLGFEPLPASFWERSSLYPLPADAAYKKNNHASAWHLDLDKDVRSLMSVQSNARWWETTHHELGHIYYYISYTRPEVPPLLREGANRGFHEAVGSLLGLASMQKPFLVAKGLIPEGTATDEVQALLKEALASVVFIPFSAGTMLHFEHDLYSKELPVDQYNQRWWEYVKKFQGIVPPAERGEEYCDAATKTHINDDPAQYYDYAISSILLNQLHAHIAEKILHQDPHATNYLEQKPVGTFLADILKLGATRDWRTVMQEQLGSDLSAKAMLDYFAPLTEYLKEQNAGRTYTLPESPAI